MYTLGGQRVKQPGGEALLTGFGWLPEPLDKVGIDVFALLIARDESLADRYEGSISQKTSFLMRVQAKSGTTINWVWFKGETKTTVTGTSKVSDNSTILEIPFSADTFSNPVFAGGGAGLYRILVNDKTFSNFISFKD
jgi:hypothetical protein